MVSAIPSFHPPSFHPRVTSSASIFPTSILRRREELSGSPFPQWSRRLATGWVPAGYFPLPDLSRRAVTHAEQGPCCSFGTRASKVGKFRGGGRERRWQGERGRACCWGDLGVAALSGAGLGREPPGRRRGVAGGAAVPRTRVAQRGARGAGAAAAGGRSADSQRSTLAGFLALRLSSWGASSGREAVCSTAERWKPPRHHAR